MIIYLFERHDECGGVSRIEFARVGLSHIDKYTYSAEEHIKVGGSFQMRSTMKF
jgi:hypothetical protein